MRSPFAISTALCRTVALKIVDSFGFFMILVVYSFGFYLIFVVYSFGFSQNIDYLCNIIPVQMSAANGLPLGAQVNPKFTRYDYLDTGLLLRVLAMNYDEDKELTRLILAGDAPDLVNKGIVAELTVGLELMKSSNPQSKYDLFYWENLDRNATSEVEYIIAKNARCLPIEVKAGISGKMKSLRLFMHRKGLTVGIRSSLENFGFLEVSDSDDTGVSVKRVIGILPLYAVWRLSNLPLPSL